MQDGPKLLTLAARIYRLLLYAYPAPFRRQYRREMAQVFRDDTRQTLRQRGVSALAGLWLLTFFDLLKTALAEHIWEVFHMPLEKIARWSGPAAVIGGALWAVLWLRGGEDFSLLWFFAAAIPFMAIALAGLYRHLPAGGGRALVFGVTLVGLVLLLASALGLAFASGDWGWTLLLSGFSVMILGIGSMGAIAIRERALGLWSLLPLVLAAFHLGSLVTIDDAGPDTVHLTFDVLGGFCWLLLGLVLWTRREDTSGPTQFA